MARVQSVGQAGDQSLQKLRVPFEFFERSAGGRLVGLPAVVFPELIEQIFDRETIGVLICIEY